jgi:hypothetical protein
MGQAGQAGKAARCAVRRVTAFFTHPPHQPYPPYPPQKSICAPTFTKRGVNTDVGASQRWAGVAGVGL